jgi:hypothetical protein
MLFVIMGKAKAGTARERLARRVNWQYPEEIRVTAEYWLPTNDPKMIAVAEADSIAPIMRAIGDWDDVLDVTVVPAMTAEQGLELARQQMQTGSSA